MPGKLLLKKYANRRLYDTEQSRYITLSELSEIVKEGRQVQVLDAKSKEDVTAFILTQIIVEQARNKNTLLPVPLLHLVIQYGENILNEFFDNYLEATIRNYLYYRKAYDDQFKKWLDMGADLSGLATQNLPPFTPLKPFLDLFSDSAKEKTPDD
ncbi:polyhydroxyalkanoate synthesis regulator DNA-binding domain-containing protein [Desulfoferrobacter suflitae]|uniref:polyhydroxyalkanoate synthesis regulator DNA-binding domain-containing protein n=1 Tax=Desulfoferrobacter suflitae TaxID=2865782 RepID=UPI002164B44D|nr:polyhydroxyalkanoate synthesis regulator DNA-binding domain-containing protein [Desulfoferrobacter suflitae]MCK8602874.1 hypothetical protein [Desulfoferrobacter suflitae]